MVSQVQTDWDHFRDQTLGADRVCTSWKPPAFDTLYKQANEQFKYQL